MRSLVITHCYATLNRDYGSPQRVPCHLVLFNCGMLHYVHTAIKRGGAMLTL